MTGDRIPRPGQTWRGYQGDEFEIVLIAHNDHNLELMVVYRSKSDGIGYVQMLSRFLGRVEQPEAQDKTWRGEKKTAPWRFELVSEAEIAEGRRVRALLNGEPESAPISAQADDDIPF